jgi:hypothetical protein
LSERTGRKNGGSSSANRSKQSGGGATNVSLTIFDTKNMQLMIKHTHIMAIPTAHPLPKFNRGYEEAEGTMWQSPWPSTKRRQCSKSSHSR